MAARFRRQPPRLPEVFQSQITPLYFVTFCTIYRQPVLANAQVHTAFRAYCEIGAAKTNIAVGRYVIMPDHIHLFVTGNASFDLGLWVRGLKRAVGKAIIAQSSESGGRPGTAATTPIWQPGFFDHLLRGSESYAQKWEYVRNNPLRAALVSRAADWPYRGEIVVMDRI